MGLYNDRETLRLTQALAVGDKDQEELEGSVNLCQHESSERAEDNGRTSVTRDPNGMKSILNQRTDEIQETATNNFSKEDVEKLFSNRFNKIPETMDLEEDEDEEEVEEVQEVQDEVRAHKVNIARKELLKTKVPRPQTLDDDDDDIIDLYNEPDSSNGSKRTPKKSVQTSNAKKKKKNFEKSCKR